MTRTVALLLTAVVLVSPACGEAEDQTLPGRASPGAEATSDDSAACKGFYFC